jgi:hypothetical protein
LAFCSFEILKNKTENGTRPDFVMRVKKISFAGRKGSLEGLQKIGSFWENFPATSFFEKTLFFLGNFAAENQDGVEFCDSNTKNIRQCAFCS